VERGEFGRRHQAALRQPLDELLDGDRHRQAPPGRGQSHFAAQGDSPIFVGRKSGQSPDRWGTTIYPLYPQADVAERPRQNGLSHAQPRNCPRRFSAGAGNTDTWTCPPRYPDYFIPAPRRRRGDSRRPAAGGDGRRNPQ
jgi:hypothetical protein